MDARLYRNRNDGIPLPDLGLVTLRQHLHLEFEIKVVVGVDDAGRKFSQSIGTVMLMYRYFTVILGILMIRFKIQGLHILTFLPSPCGICEMA